MPNYYTSPKLLDILKLNGTYTYGTVRRNRKQMPRAFMRDVARDKVYSAEGTICLLSSSMTNLTYYAVVVPQLQNDLSTGQERPSCAEAKHNCGLREEHGIRDCVACNLPTGNRQGFKHHQSIFGCHSCKVALRVPQCIQVYHTDCKAALRQ